MRNTDGSRLSFISVVIRRRRHRLRHMLRGTSYESRILFYKSQLTGRRQPLPSSTDPIYRHPPPTVAARHRRPPLADRRKSPTARRPAFRRPADPAHRHRRQPPPPTTRPPPPAHRHPPTVGPKRGRNSPNPVFANADVGLPNESPQALQSAYPCWGVGAWDGRRLAGATHLACTGWSPRVDWLLRQGWGGVG